LNEFGSLDQRWGWAVIGGKHASAVTLAGSIVVVVLASYGCSIIRDVRDAQDELRQLFYHAALSAKGLEHDETVRDLYRHGQPFRRILEQIAD